MSKRMQWLILLLIVLTTCSKTTSPDNSPQTDTWTVMLYNDADCEIMLDPSELFADSFKSSDIVNVLILRDTYGEESAMNFVDSSGELVVVDHPGECNMGSEQTMSYLLGYAKENYSGDKYMLCIYDHGSGWEGSCLDETDDNDLLTSIELGNALKKNGGVDIILFTAPCLMGSFEAAYEVRNYADLWVASENISGYTFWINTLPDVYEYLNTGLYENYRDFGKFIVDDIYRETLIMAESFDLECFTISAVDLKKLDTAVIDLNSVCDILCADIDTLRNSFHLIDNYIETYPGVDVFPEGMRDYCDVLQNFKPFYPVEKQAAFDKAIESFQNAVVGNYHLSDFPDSQGLTINLQTSFSDFEMRYIEYGFEFLADSKWDEFLAAFYGEALINAQKSFDKPRIYNVPELDSCIIPTQ